MIDILWALIITAELFTYPFALVYCLMIAFKSEGIEKPLWLILAVVLMMQSNLRMNGDLARERGEKAGIIIGELIGTREKGVVSCD